MNISSNLGKDKRTTQDEYRSFNKGDIAEVFRRIYDVANALASKDGLMWIQVKYKQDMIDEMSKREKSQGANEDKETQLKQKSLLKNGLLPPLLEMQLYEFVQSKREEYMQHMTKMLELYAKSKWGRAIEEAEQQ